MNKSINGEECEPATFWYITLNERLAEQTQQSYIRERMLVLSIIEGLIKISDFCYLYQAYTNEILDLFNWGFLLYKEGNYTTTSLGSEIASLHLNNLIKSKKG